jgi:hypothetical protein
MTGKIYNCTLGTKSETSQDKNTYFEYGAERLKCVKTLDAKNITTEQELPTSGYSNSPPVLNFCTPKVFRHFMHSPPSKLYVFLAPSRIRTRDPRKPGSATKT